MATDSLFVVCRSLYGQCVFSQKVKANTDLADELLAATKSPQFAANALQLQASFNSTILPYETEYWATTAAGMPLHIRHYSSHPCMYVCMYV